EPSPVHYISGTIIAFAAVILAIWLRSLASLRLGIQLCALWAGFCLLPLHGILLGTPMLLFPAYGEYEAVVDEVISVDGEQSRVIVSDFRPLAESGAVPV